MFKNIFKSKSNEEEFWDWFLKNEPDLYYGTDDIKQREKIFDGLTKRIKAIDSNLAYAFSPIQDGELKEFIISADGLKESFPQVINLIKVAPIHPNWKFLAFRQPNLGDDLSIKMGDLEIGYNDIFFRFLEEEGKLQIELNIRNFDKSGFQQNAVYLLLDSLIGEYDVVTEIDFIDWEILDESKIENFYRFTELRKLIESRKKEKADNK